MSWMTSLLETYDAVAGNKMVMGKAELERDKNGNRKRELRPLTPPYHTLVKVQTIVEINAQGQFVRAVPVGKQEQQYYIVPTTNDAETRTGTKAARMPFPLHEKIKNIVIDDPVEGYANYYMRALHDLVTDAAFVGLPDAKKRGIEAVYTYLSKGTLEVDVKRDVPNTKPEDFVCFAVDGLGADVSANLSANPDAWDAWIAYAQAHSHDGDTPYGMCYATGEQCELMQKGPRSIVAQGDGAKLFSVQRGSTVFPSTGRFTYWGTYFERPEDCMSIGREAVEKSTAMLRWLIDRQGWKPAMSSSQVTVVWDKVHPLAGDKVSVDVNTLYERDPAFGMDEEAVYDTGKEHASLVRKSRDGRYVAGISDIAQKVVVMTIDVPTTARASIVYYNEYDADMFVANALAWHDDAGWEYWDYNKQRLVKRAPSVRDCLQLALGPDYTAIKAKTDLAPNIALEVIRCINNRSLVLPYSLISAAAERLIHTERWAQKETGKYEGAYLTFACGLFRKYYNQKGMNIMASLDENINDRSYLFGRVLAYYERIESLGMWQMGTDHETSASKMRVMFFSRPADTSELLLRKMQPYFGALRNRGEWYKQGLMNLLARIGTDSLNEPLDNAMGLMGYAAQMTEFRSNKKEDVE